jgi:uncharacterized protein (DUF433 family)
MLPVNTKHIIFPEGVPLVDRYEGGIRTIRVIGSRITLDTLVHIYQRGETVEYLARGFPTLSLDQIKAVIDWYLTHQREADEYLKEGEIVAERLRQWIESQPGYAERREKLLRYREQMSRT